MPIFHSGWEQTKLAASARGARGYAYCLARSDGPAFGCSSPEKRERALKARGPKKRSRADRRLYPSPNWPRYWPIEERSLIFVSIVPAKHAKRALREDFEGA